MLKRILIVLVWVLVAFNAAYLTVRIVRDRDLFPTAGVDAGANRFKEAVELIKENYAGGPGLGADQLTDKALEEMMKSLDPHSEYLTRKRFDTVQNDLRGEFGGIGVQIELKDNRVTVIAPIAGTPGERAGILRGDQIIKVNGDLITDPPLNSAIEKLRGRPGTTVDVTLHRPSSDKDIDVTITREIIRQDTIRAAQFIEPGIGYIHLTQFNERSGLEFREALTKLEREGMHALVLDLRNNPGGLLNVAVEVAQPFFKHGELVVYTQGRTPESRQNYTAQGDSVRRDYPIAVLVNSGSASASEVVTGALRDTHRAFVVGERTFGKGSVQSILPLRNGDALRLTTARYYTPGGRVIHEVGIEPDIEVPVSVEEEGKLLVQRLRRDYGDTAEFKQRFGFDPVQDVQLLAATDMLRGVLAMSPARPSAVASAAP
jgi:carboxyl-terminal processing protease